MSNRTRTNSNSRGDFSGRWNRKIDKIITREVSKRPCLYDRQNTDYSDKPFNAKCWDDIGRPIKRKGAEVKKRWVNIRDYFRKMLKLRASMSDVSWRRKKWSLFDDCAWLIPYMNGVEDIAGPFKFPLPDHVNKSNAVEDGGDTNRPDDLTGVNPGDELEKGPSEDKEYYDETEDETTAKEAEGSQSEDNANSWMRISYDLSSAGIKTEIPDNDSLEFPNSDSIGCPESTSTPHQQQHNQPEITPTPYQQQQNQLDITSMPYQQQHNQPEITSPPYQRQHNQPESTSTPHLPHRNQPERNGDRFKINTKNQEDAPSDILQSTLSSILVDRRSEDHDDDLLFFKSCLPQLKLLPPLERLEFRSQISTMLLDFVKRSRSNSSGGAEDNGASPRMDDVVADDLTTNGNESEGGPSFSKRRKVSDSN